MYTSRTIDSFDIKIDILREYKDKTSVTKMSVFSYVTLVKAYK